MKTITNRLFPVAAIGFVVPALAQTLNSEHALWVDGRPITAVPAAASIDNDAAARADQQPVSAGNERKADGVKLKSVGSLEEVIVTAQKRAERLQDVPISITALSEEALMRTGADKAAEYISQTPGAFYSDAGQGRSRINIRGLQTTNSATFEEGQSPTAIYIDDLPSLSTSNPWAQTDLRLYDIERIEVLRGPQGTLFGSGALGGALRIITNKPDLQHYQGGVEAGLETTHGGDESWNISSRINLPLVQNRFALRAMGYWRQDGGWVENTFRNEKGANSTESKGGRLMLAYNPNDEVSLRLTVLRQEDFSDDKSAVNFSGSAPYKFSGWTPAYTDSRLTFYNLNADINFGPLLVTSATSYADSRANLGQGLGLPFQYAFNWRTSPDATFGEDNIFTAKTFAQELRVTSHHGGRLQWVAGGFYMDQDLGQDQHWYSSTVVAITSSTTIGAWSVPAKTKQKALFGEVNFNLSDTVAIVAGARLFEYSFERFNEFAFGILADPTAQYPTPVREIDESGVTPRAAIRYKPTDKMMVYVQAAEGFRIGQPNYSGGLTDAGNGFVYPLGSKSDRLWNYELGVKSGLLNNTLRLNASLFYIDWKDMQLQRGNPLPNAAIACCFTDNPGDATSKGAEIEIEYMPTNYLTLGTSHSVADAKLTSIEESGTNLIAGNRLPGTPEYWSSNYIQLSGAGLIGQADAYLRLSHRYVGGVISDINNHSPFAFESDSYNVFDARGGLSFGKYEVVLYMDNVANSDAAVSGTRDPSLSAEVTGGGYLYRLRPRTVGLTFRADF